MDTDDLDPPAPKPGTHGLGTKDLDELSIEALQDYISELKAEVARAETAIGAKQSARAGAEAFFRS